LLADFTRRPRRRKDFWVGGAFYSGFTDCTTLTSVTFQSNIASSKFHNDAFNGLGDLHEKFYVTDKANGTPGTYIKSGSTWTKK